MSRHVFDRQKWASLTVFEQLGNIGSEVGRTFSAQRRGDDEALKGAFYRGLDLFDATAEIWAAREPARLRELLRAREIFAQAVMMDKTDFGLEEYFMQYAIAARLHR